VSWAERLRRRWGDTRRRSLAITTTIAARGIVTGYVVTNAGASSTRRLGQHRADAHQSARFARADSGEALNEVLGSAAAETLSQPIVAELVVGASGDLVGENGEVGVGALPQLGQLGVPAHEGVVGQVCDRRASNRLESRYRPAVIVGQGAIEHSNG
jgi:hypothetical protein